MGGWLNPLGDRTAALGDLLAGAFNRGQWPSIIVLVATVAVLEWVGGWVGGLGWLVDRKMEEKKAVRTRYCELGIWLGGWVGRTTFKALCVQMPRLAQSLQCPWNCVGGWVGGWVEEEELM